MKVESHNGVRGRAVLVGMAVSDQVVARVSGKWTKDGLFASPWENLVAKWCVQYHRKYGKAPGPALESMYAAWAERGADKDAAAAVKRFLETLDGDYRRLRKGVNPQHVLDEAAAHFNEVRRRKFLAEYQGLLDVGDGEAADKLVGSYNKIEVADHLGKDLFLDEVLMRAAASPKSRDVLLRPRGALGTFFGDSLERSGFVAFLGPEKRGKTYQMLELAYQAMLARRRVAFFEVGDLTELQISNRFAVRATMRPRVAKTVRYPVSLELEREGSKVTAVPGFEDREFKALNPDAAWRAAQKVMRDRVKSKDSFLKLFTAPTDSMTAEQVLDVCRRLADGGWPPDFVFIDYADILAAPPGYRESRDGINATWKTLSRLRQELHCCVVTGTQANAASYSVDSLDMSNFSEDKRKFAHVTGMIGLNQSAEEKRDQVMRYNWLVLREDEFHAQRYCYLVGCLDLANPCVLSAF